MKQNDYHSAFSENEKEANKYSEKCMRVMAIVIAVIWMLNLLGVFIVPQGIMAIASVGSILLLLTPTVVGRFLKKDSKYTKVCSMVCCLVAITLLAAAMPKHGIIAWAAPIALSCHYYSKKFTFGTLIASIVLMAISLPASAFWGEWDVSIFGRDIAVGAEIIVGAYKNTRDFTPDIYRRIFVFMLLPRALTLVGISAVCSTLANRTHRLLERQVKDSMEKQRIASELDVATHIQTSMLPCIFPAFPDHREFDVYASMTPAREVGGDFYDFFMVDEKNLAIVMADVSDKGVPAALFMVIGKTLIKDHTVPGADLGEVFTKVNKLLCESNSEGLFITAFEGVLNLETGEFRYVNAGHEMPYIYRKGEAFKPEKVRPGFVLAGMETVRYKSGSLMLDEGDKIFLYTDGVTEAADGDQQLFGAARLVQALNRVKNEGAEGIIHGVQKDIAAFVCEADQSDDMTMLCLTFKSKLRFTVKDEITVDAKADHIETVTDFVNHHLEETGCSMKVQMQIDIVIDELFGNISRYAYPDEQGKATVQIEIGKDPLFVELTFIDSGAPYNPLQQKDPDLTLSAEEREIGGLGIFMVKKTMEDIRYEYRDGRNILSVRKNL